MTPAEQTAGKRQRAAIIRRIRIYAFLLWLGGLLMGYALRGILEGNP